jgi:hypothetical protein
MKRATFLGMFLCLKGTGTFAQRPIIVEDFKPSFLKQAGKECPTVNSQGYARFILKASKAQSVRVSLYLLASFLLH